MIFHKQEDSIFRTVNYRESVAEINLVARKLGWENVSESSLVARCGHLDDVTMRLRDGEEHVGLSFHNRVSTR